MTVTAEDVRAAVLARVGKSIAARGLSADAVPDDFDLLAEGLVDSFGLLDLISAIEDQFGLAVDFESIDAVDLTAIGPFSRFVAASAGNGQPPQLAAQSARPTVQTTPVRRSGRRRSPLGTAALRAYTLGTRARNKLFSLSIGGAFAEFGSHSVLQLPVRLVNEHRIAVGSGVFVGASSWLQVLEPDGDVALSIGDGVSIAGNVVLSASESLRIGDHVSFARNVYVADHSHAYADVTRPILAQGIADVLPVEIDDGAWLGQNVVVLGGVRIGKGAVVSAGSVVTSDIGDHCLAVGAPARVVRRFGSDR